MQMGAGVVMGGHFVAVAALLVQAEPGVSALHVKILDPHAVKLCACVVAFLLVWQMPERVGGGCRWANLLID